MLVFFFFLTGLSWAEVQPPEEEDKLVQVAVGTNAVWATTVSGKVKGNNKPMIDTNGFLSVILRLLRASSDLFSKPELAL